MSQMHQRCFCGAQHAVDLPDVLTVCVNQHTAKCRRGSCEGHKKATFVASSLYGSLKHAHHLLQTGSEVAFMVPVSEAHPSAA